jgi:polyisoprenyl-phosphate glycosyltransferase
MEKIELSVVVPVYNEEAVLEEFHRRLKATLDGTGVSREIVFVDDGSRDGTLPILRKLRNNDPAVRIVALSRNFGHQNAISAGLDRAAGRACVIMDADLQDPPELIPALLEKWREGFEVVYAVRTGREGESFFKRWTAGAFYRVLGWMAGVAIPRDAVRELPERNRFLRGLVGWVGFRQTGVPFERPARAAGETKFSLFKMIRFALDGITSFSRLPLRLVTLVGFLCFAVSVAVLGWVFYVKFIGRTSVQGWTSLIGVVLGIGGAQLLALGILGEYVARIFDESKRRPLYIVRQTEGFKD